MEKNLVFAHAPLEHVENEFARRVFLKLKCRAGAVRGVEDDSNTQRLAHFAAEIFDGLPDVVLINPEIVLGEVQDGPAEFVENRDRDIDNFHSNRDGGWSLLRAYVLAGGGSGLNRR